MDTIQTANVCLQNLETVRTHTQRIFLAGYVKDNAIAYANTRKCIVGTAHSFILTTTLNNQLQG